MGLRKQQAEVEQENEHSRIHYSEAFHASPEVSFIPAMFVMTSKNLIAIISPDGYFKKISRSFSDLLGYEEDELLRMPVTNYIEKGRADAATIANYYFENSFRCKNGNVVSLRWRVVPGLVEDALVIVGWQP